MEPAFADLAIRAARRECVRRDRILRGFVKILMADTAQQTPITTTLLLERLHDSSNEWAWRAFDERFRGVIVATGLRLGLGQSDAEEVAQETIFQALRDYQSDKYDRAKGRLSSWIVSIAHHRVIDLKRRRRREHRGDGGGETPASEPLERDVAEAFERALERRIFEQAWEQVRGEGRTGEEILLAFELTALRGVAPAEAARRCGMSVEQVYVAKTRVTQRIREAVERIDQIVRNGL